MKMSKKAMVSMHPVATFVVGVILGMILMYLIAKGTIPLGINVCP